MGNEEMPFKKKAFAFFRLRKAIALILSFLVIIVLTALTIVIFTRSISENNLTRRYTESTNAFWLAEAGINKALDELRNNYSLTGTNLWPTPLNQGGYSVDIVTEGQNRKVTSHGFIPFSSSRIERLIEATMTKYIPPNFYDNSLYCAASIDLNGSSYSVTGDVRYAGTLDNPGNITGTATQDSTISPLALLDFQQLYTISQSQGNVFDDDRLQDVQRGWDSFPASFWYSAPTDPSDPSTGVPNIVYVTTDLQLNGNIGTIGGFFVVAGDVITNPLNTSNTSLNGSGQIEGAIYTRGQFNVNGGGNNLNVNGGIWAGQEITLNGSVGISYNSQYMAALGSLNINADVQIISWKDLNPPYTL